MSTPAAATDSLLVERDGALLVVTLNRPQARNAIDHATATAVAAAMDRLDADDTLQVGILTGAGGTFCAGLDLKAFLRGEPRLVEGRGFAGLTESPPRKPLVAAVEGHALAGGFEIVLTCDLVVAARDAVFGLPEVKRGLIAGSGGLLRLPGRIPHHVAMEHALTGDPLTAEQAHGWGLVNHLTEPGQALAAAKALAHRVAVNAPLALAASKELVGGAAGWDEPEAWRRQLALLDAVVTSDDAAEGARAFVEKRPPAWRGA